MSYLDKPQNKEEYFKNISTRSKSHQIQSGIALDWFEKFCIGQYDGRTTNVVLADFIKLKYDNPQKFPQNFFGMLQDYINYLQLNVNGAETIRGYFNLLKKYLNWYGLEVYSETVKAKLNFPKKIEEKAYPLTLDDIEKLLAGASEKRRILYMFLSSTGLRISESLQIRKRDLDFDYDRIMIRVVGKYTKTKKPRETFITKETAKYLEPMLKKMKVDDLLFGTHDDHLISKHNEEDYFHRLRKKVGLIEKYDSGIHKITLHSFRSWFVTKCNRVDADFGNTLAGHQKYMKKYNRFEESELCELFIKAEPTLSIFDHVNTEQYDKSIVELNDRLSKAEEVIRTQKIQYDTLNHTAGDIIQKMVNDGLKKAGVYSDYTPLTDAEFEKQNADKSPQDIKNIQHLRDKKIL